MLVRKLFRRVVVTTRSAVVTKGVLVPYYPNPAFYQKAVWEAGELLIEGAYHSGKIVTMLLSEIVFGKSNGCIQKLNVHRIDYKDTRAHDIDVQQGKADRESYVNGLVLLD